GLSLPNTSPPSSTAPASGECTPEITLIRVDLPLPFSPARQWISPGAISSETSSRACTPAKALLTPRTAMTLFTIGASFRADCCCEPRGAEVGAERCALPRRCGCRDSEAEAVHVLLGDDHPAVALEDLVA